MAIAGFTPMATRLLTIVQKYPSGLKNIV